MGALTSDERRFDDPAGWRHIYKDERFDQRLLVVSDTIFAETLVTIRSSPTPVLALLQEPWDWWDHGTIFSSTRHADGSLDMDLKPIRWYIMRMSLRILPPEPSPDGRGTRLPVIYAGGFEGPGSIDVYANPTVAGQSILRGRLTGIRPHFPLPFVKATAIGPAHLRTEAGRLIPPLPKGTGYVGLIRRAEDRAGSIKNEKPV